MAIGFFVSIKGKKHGDFKGETGKNQTQIPVSGFNYGVTAPHDVATGHASGKRQQKPVTFIKEWGAVSVQLFEAMVTNEVLSPVIIQEVRADPSGKEEVYMEIRLTNATISEIAIDPEQLEGKSDRMSKELERISLVFEKIEIDNKVSGKSASDDWEQRP